MQGPAPVLRITLHIWVPWAVPAELLLLPPFPLKGAPALDDKLPYVETSVSSWHFIPNAKANLGLVLSRK